jgi:antitoxin component of RelBE/YafQ-DinJ toxin-antitoxin module
MKKDKVILTRVDENVAERIENIANNSKDLELTKSEVVRIILYAFFTSQQDKDFAKVRELAIKMRKGLL